MSDEDALLAAICADPADDTVRLAFADHLDESGDEVAAAWAGFIRAHLRLGTGTELAGDVPTVQQFGSDEWLDRFTARAGFPIDSADARSATLLWRSDGPILRPVSGVTVGDWERGFPDRLQAEYQSLRDRWGALCVRVPFSKLDVWAVRDAALEELVTWPRLDRLTALNLVTQTGGDSDMWASAAHRALDERGVAALANCPALSGLESLELRYVEITHDVADLILGSPYLRRLRRLTLHPLTHWDGQNLVAFARLQERFGPGAFPQWR